MKVKSTYKNIVLHYGNNSYNFENYVCDIPDEDAIYIVRLKDYKMAEPWKFNFNKDSWIKDRKLIWDGAVGYNNGYGNCSTWTMEGLYKNDIDVYPMVINDWVYVLDYLTPISEELIKKRIKKQDCFVVKNYPAESMIDEGIKNEVAYTMFETSRIHKDWVDNLNNNTIGVCVPCRQQKKAFEDSGVKVPIEVVPIGLNTDLFPEVKRSDDGKFIVGSMGTLTYRKGTDILVRAFKKAFPREKYPDCYLYLKTLGTNGVTFAWFLDKGETDDRIILETKSFSPEELIKDFFAKIDCFAFPTHGEGFGLPAIEAMCVGLPTIGTNWSGMSEFIGDERYSYPLDYKLVKVPHGDWRGYPDRMHTGGMEWADADEDQLVEYLREIYKDRDKANAKGKKAREYVLKNFNNKTTSKKMIDFLDKLV